MATYIKTLKDENGDTVLPRTSKSAIQDIINEVPSDGTTGQVLTKTSTGYTWANAKTILTIDDYLTNAEIEEILGSDIFWDGTVN